MNPWQTHLKFVWEAFLRLKTRSLAIDQHLPHLLRRDIKGLGAHVNLLVDVHTGDYEEHTLKKYDQHVPFQFYDSNLEIDNQKNVTNVIMFRLTWAI